MMKGFHETMQSLDAAYPWTTPLSSAGLVYFHYGHRVLAEVIGCDESDDIVKRIFKKFYTDFVEAVDGFHNGILPSDEAPGFLVSTNLGDRVAALNLSWNDHYAACKANDQFRNAMTLVGSEFTEGIKDLRNVWWPARKIVEEAFKRRFQTDESGAILFLEPGCSWKEHLVDYEMEHHLENNIKFVTFKDGLTDEYRVQGVPTRLGSQNVRLLLPNEWRGLQGDELQRVNGIPGSLVVKRAGYIGSGKTYDSVYQMARKTIAMANR